MMGGIFRRTHTSPQDAHKPAGRTQGASLLWTGLVVLARGSRKTRRDPACLGGMDARCHPATFHVPAIDQDTRRFYAEHVHTHPTPVHSRDAACPRPVISRASLTLACVLRHYAPHAPAGVLRACARPAPLRTPRAGGRPAPSRTPRAGGRPAGLCASCAITHPTCRRASCGRAGVLPVPHSHNESHAIPSSPTGSTGPAASATRRRGTARRASTEAISGASPARQPATSISPEIRPGRRRSRV